MMRKAETGMAQAGWLSEKPARKIVIRERQEDAELIRKQATAPSLMNQRALALLWQILSSAGFPNQFFNDS